MLALTSSVQASKSSLKVPKLLLETDKSMVGRINGQEKYIIQVGVEEQEVKWSESRLVMCDFFRPHGLSMDSPWNSPGQNTGVGSLSHLQGISPTWPRDWTQVSHFAGRFFTSQLSHKVRSREQEWGRIKTYFRSIMIKTSKQTTTRVQIQRENHI